MSDFFTRVAIATIRFFGIGYGAFLLLFSPFAFSGVLASEAVGPSNFATNFMVGLTMAWVGATLIVPLRSVVARPAWTWLLCASYASSAVLLLINGVSIGDGGLRFTLWQIAFVVLNVAGLVYLLRSKNSDGA